METEQEYIDSLLDQYGTLQSYEPSLREKAVGALVNLGMPMNTAQGFMGNLAEENILDSLGIVDFTPLGLPFVFDEAKRGFTKAEKPTDYIAPTVEAGLGVAEAFPVTKLMAQSLKKPVAEFLSSLGSKIKSEPMPTDKKKRELLKGMAVATPVAVGALSEIPLSKVIDDIAPIAKKTKFNLDLSNLKSFKNKIDDFIEMAIDEGDNLRVDALEDATDKELLEATLDVDISDARDFEGSFLEKMINEIKEKNPKGSDQEIFNEIAGMLDGGKEYLSNLIPQEKLNFKFTPET